MQGAWPLLLLVASGPRLDMRGTDFVDSIEINTYGEQPRTALIYRDADGIRDWRWQTEANLPTLVRPGLWLTVWSDQGKIRIVRARAACYTRTLRDVELMERKHLPDDKRRKLAR